MNKFSIVENLYRNVKDTEKENELLEAINEAKEELEMARQYFDQVNDPQLIDYAIYTEQAAKSRFIYLMKKAKENGITAVDRFERLETNIV